MARWTELFDIYRHQKSVIALQIADYFIIVYIAVENIITLRVS